MTVSINGTTGISGVDGSASTPALQGSDTNTGISFGTDTVAINTGGTARVTVNSSGNVGIGSSSPQQLLHVNSSGSNGGQLQVTNTSTGATSTDGLVIGYDTANDVIINNQEATQIKLFTSGAERARITSGGNVAINNASADGRINAQFNGASEIGYISRDTSNTGTTAAVRFYRNTTSQVGEIATSTTGTAYNTSSDYRLKENVVPLTGATERLAQLPVHRFNFIADPDCTVDGFLAHEAQSVVPECVTGEKDAIDSNGNPVYQGIDQSKLVPLLTAALQEAITRIETLEAEVQALKGGN